LFVPFVISLLLAVAVASLVNAVIDGKFFDLFSIVDDDKDEEKPLAVDVDFVLSISMVMMMKFFVNERIQVTRILRIR
jgi:hypothetical protein